MQLRKVICLFIFLLSTSVYAQAPDLMQNYSEIMRSIYNYEFDQANRLIKNSSTNSNQNELDMLKSNLAWWQIVSGELSESQWTSSYEETTSAVIKRLSKKAQDSINNDELAILLHSYFLRTRYNMLRGDYFDGMKDLQNCLAYTKKSLNRSDESESLNLGAGLYNYLIAKSYDEYLLLRPYLSFYPSGNADLGLQQIQACQNSENRLIRTEARYFLMKIFNEWEDNQERSLEYCTMLCKDYPQNLIFKIYRIELLHSMENKEFNSEILAYRSLLRKDVYSPEIRRYFSNLLDEKFN